MSAWASMRSWRFHKPPLLGNRGDLQAPRSPTLSLRAIYKSLIGTELPELPCCSLRCRQTPPTGQAKMCFDNRVVSLASNWCPQMTSKRKLWLFWPEETNSQWPSCLRSTRWVHPQTVQGFVLGSVKPACPLSTALFALFLEKKLSELSAQTPRDHRKQALSPFQELRRQLSPMGVVHNENKIQVHHQPYTDET